MFILLVFFVIGIWKLLFIYLFFVMLFNYFGISVRNASLLTGNLDLFILGGKYVERRELREDVVALGHVYDGHGVGIMD